MKKLAAMLLACLLLAACGAPQAESPAPTREALLQAVEELNQYEEDHLLTAVTQMEINEQSGILFEKWNALLAETERFAKASLTEEERSKFETDAAAWLQVREQAVEAAGAEVQGGSAESMVRCMESIRYTKERVSALLTQ